MHSFGNSSIWIEEKVKLLIRADVGNSKDAAWTQEIKLNLLKGDVEEIFSFTKGMIFRFLNIIHNQKITKASKYFQNYTLTWYVLKFHISYEQLFYQNGNDRISENRRLEWKSRSHLVEPTYTKQSNIFQVAQDTLWAQPGSEYLQG